MLYELRDLVRTFKGRMVLQVPRLGIEASRIYSLVGPNGAGKTTLLNLLAFLDQPNGGSLRFYGDRVDYRPQQLLALRRRVVLVDQYPILFTGSVHHNVGYGLKVRGVAKAERQQRVAEVLNLVGMERFAKADAHKLSGGETKRVALARALAVRPEVLLCDEPGANVDRENQEHILQILERINREEQTSIIFSTHYLSQGNRLAHHTLMLEHGTLTDLAGENSYRACIVSRTGDRALCQLPGQVHLEIPVAKLPPEAETCKVQIDPAGVRLGTGQRAQAGSVFAGHVVKIQQERGQVRLTIDLGIRLDLLLSLAEYLAEPPVLGTRLQVCIPDGAVRCSGQ